MSAKHAPHSDAPDPVDPYGIVPDSFTDDWNADSIAEALAKAEAAPSTTDPRAQQRCPDCLAARLTPLPDDRGADWACTECHGRHDAVLPSERDAARQADHAPDTDRESALPRCRGCLSTALYPIPERAPLDARWACLDCGERFDTALPSELDTRRGEATKAEKARIGEVMRE
jgi:hypothetical protein